VTTDEDLRRTAARFRLTNTAMLALLALSIAYVPFAANPQAVEIFVSLIAVVMSKRGINEWVLADYFTTIRDAMFR
jgi:hypothetical protein